MIKVPVKVAVLPVALAGLLLAGCATNPQVAARVGHTSISTARVDDLTRVECTLSAGSGQQGAAQPLRLRRETTLGRLMDYVVLRELAKSDGGHYDHRAYAAQLGQIHNDLAALPASQRSVAEDFFPGYLKAVLQLTEAARSQLVAQGVQKPDSNQVQQAMQHLYAAERQKLHIEVNPAYSPDGEGVPGAGDGSLSVAVSSYAKQAASGQPGQDYVAGLPKNQLC